MDEKISSFVAYIIFFQNRIWPSSLDGYKEIFENYIVKYNILGSKTKTFSESQLKTYIESQ